MMRRLVLIFGGLAFIGLVGAGIYVSVRAAYGAFDKAYYVSVDIDRAGQQLAEGSDVRIKGVEIGKVAQIELVDGRARLQLKIKDEYRIPKRVQAVVSLKTPLGAKYVDLQFPAAASGPFLADGDVIDDAHVGPELEDLLADGTRVLDAINPEDAATVVSELATGARGHGEDIARSLDANSDLSGLFASTLHPQLEALHDFDTIFGELEDKGVDLNLLAAAVNTGARVYATSEAERNLQRALTALVPFSDDLGDLLILQKDDFDRMYNNGDKVFDTIAARPDGLHDLVHGLYRYVFKLGQDIQPEFMLNDGSAGAGFTAFIGGNDKGEDQEQICDVFPPDSQEQIPACAGTDR